MTFKVPENEAEIDANRAKFIKALINEDPHAQCRGELFMREIPEDGKAAKEMRCAVGVAAKVFLGLNTKDEYLRYANPAEHYPGHDVYEEIATMLGTTDGCTHIWRLNDDDEKSFADVGATLRNEWSLNE